MKVLTRVSHACHISQHIAVTNCKREKKTNLLLPSSREKGNLHFKIAAHSHYTELMDLLYWIMGSQLREVWYKKPNDFVWKNYQTSCESISHFFEGAETGWQFREHTDIWENRRRMRRKLSQQLFVSFRTNHLEII